MMKIIARSCSTANKLVIRCAAANEIPHITRQAIKEGWHVGPYDYHCAYAFDPNGFFIGEVDGKVIGHISAITYPNHHIYIGALIVADKFRASGYGKNIAYRVYDTLNKNYTTGCDVDSKLKSNLSQDHGFQTAWHTYVATLSPEMISEKLSTTKAPTGAIVTNIHNIDIKKLLQYDASVFGTPRQKFMENWINIPGSFGWAVVNEMNDDVMGYAVIKPAIRDAGTEIGLAIAPLFADNVEVARLLLKTAAEKCLSNEAIPNTKLELVHPVGNDCGEGSSGLMRELEAELTHIAYRVYSKGIPPGRQLGKIYGIVSPTFD